MNPTAWRVRGVQGSRSTRLVLAPLLATTLGGCAEAAEGSRASVLAERDSAGIHIVELSDPYRGSLPEWEIRERLAIGQAVGRPEYELFDVVGATLLGDGSIAVANEGTAEIRIFDRNGGHVRTFGREGDGPGEFRRLSWLGSTDHELLVAFDEGLRRATWFTRTGEVVRTVTVEPDVTEPTDETRFWTTSVEAVGFSRGRLLVRTGLVRLSVQGEYRDMFTLALLDEGGAPRDSLASYPGRELYAAVAPSGLTLSTPPIFGREAHVAAFAGRLLAGTTDRFAIDVYDRGALQMRIVASVESAPATRSEVDAWLGDRRQRLAGAPNEQVLEVYRLSIEGAPVRETPPAFQRLMLDSERSIWIEEPYRVPNGPSRWIVLAADGTPAARVELPMKGPTSPATPPDLTIFEIGEDYILALRRDGQEVEHVVVYGLERG